MNNRVTVGVIGANYILLREFEYLLRKYDVDIHVSARPTDEIFWTINQRKDILIVEYNKQIQNSIPNWEKYLINLRLIYYIKNYEKLELINRDYYNKHSIKIYTWQDLIHKFDDIISSEITETAYAKFQSNPLEYSTNKGNVINDINVVNKEWSKILKKSPDDIHKLTSRQFEEFIAEIWSKRGYEVNLTKNTRDGGKDIYAYKKSSDGETLFAIECKKYNPIYKVGRPLIQQLNGIIESERLTGGMLATTSYFTSDAIEFAKPLRHRLFLKDLENIKDILNNE